MSYAGESIQKKIARAMAYEAASKHARHVDGGIVCLAGPGAHDVGPISCFFPDVPPERVLFVDIDEAGLRVARDRMPGCLTHHGPLDTAIVPWKVKLAVLDFCGHLHGANLSGASRVARRLAYGGVVLLTTLKGREATGHHRLMVSLVRKDERDWARAHANVQLLAKCLDLPFVSPNGRLEAGQGKSVSAFTRVLADVGGVHYTANRSPMAMSFMRLERWIDTEKRVKAASRLQQPGEYLDEFGRDPVHRLLAALARAPDLRTANRSLVRRTDGPPLALDLSFPPQAYDVTARTLAAWRAHRTMGTYAKLGHHRA